MMRFLAIVVEVVVVVADKVRKFSARTLAAWLCRVNIFRVVHRVFPSLPSASSSLVAIAAVGNESLSCCDDITKWRLFLHVVRCGLECTSLPQNYPLLLIRRLYVWIWMRLRCRVLSIFVAIRVLIFYPEISTRCISNRAVAQILWLEKMLGERMNRWLDGICWFVSIVEYRVRRF